MKETDAGSKNKDKLRKIMMFPPFVDILDPKTATWNTL